jgi:hypothetical protein
LPNFEWAQPTMQAVMSSSTLDAWSYI